MCVLLKELEGLDSSSTVWEEKTQIILSHSFPGYTNTHSYHLREKQREACFWTVRPHRDRNLSSTMCSGYRYRMLERWSVADGGKMFWKFLDPGFLNRWRGEPEKSVRSENKSQTAGLIVNIHDVPRNMPVNCADPLWFLVVLALCYHSK